MQCLGLLVIALAVLTPAPAEQPEASAAPESTHCTSAAPALDAVEFAQAGWAVSSECQITLRFCAGASDCHAVNCPGWGDTGHQTCQITYGNNTAELTCPSGQTWHVRACACDSPSGGICTASGTFATCQ